MPSVGKEGRDHFVSYRGWQWVSSPVFCQGTDLESLEARDEGRGRWCWTKENGAKCCLSQSNKPFWMPSLSSPDPKSVSEDLLWIPLPEHLPHWICITDLPFRTARTISISSWNPWCLHKMWPRVRIKVLCWMNEAYSKQELKTDSHLSTVSLVRASQATNSLVFKDGNWKMGDQEMQSKIT